MIVLIDLLVIHHGVAIVLREALADAGVIFFETTVVISETLIVFEFFIDKAVLIITSQIL